MNRSAKRFEAYALIAGDKLAMFGAEVPVFWLRKVAQREAAERNENGFHVHVEKIIIERSK